MKAKSKKKMVWTYCPHHSFTRNFKGEVKTTTMQSQLYKLGVYVIVDNNSKWQFNLTPEHMMKVDKCLKRDELAGEITNLVFSSPIRVTTDADRFFIQIEDGQEKVD